MRPMQANRPSLAHLLRVWLSVQRCIHLFFLRLPPPRSTSREICFRYSRQKHYKRAGDGAYASMRISVVWMNSRENPLSRERPSALVVRRPSMEANKGGYVLLC
eukprot:TRINITY_DN1237_c0_g1_i4.p1 TRINITY_DN1237_c0_g1~~TRINITY_DN1237_c0_g1_i4.p1  ORF type:complete len:104 (+),score=0.52 TRINITY_DN1237_c0_g1_i4:159-470(+)